ncbi:MAG: rRNA maturation RNase YbeY [Beijerinckiaceae bacterium]
MIAKPVADLDVSVDVQRQSAAWKTISRVTGLARKAAKRALSMSGVAILPGAEIAISLADDATVQASNKEWRAKDAPTNVLSFPSVPANRISRTPFLGDVILAFETVEREAITEEKPIEHHMMHLVVHGVLHVVGYDHMTKADAERMEALETLILASLAVPDPYGDTEPLEIVKP